MLLLRFIVKAIKLLNSETSAASLAAAVALGMFLGLVPFLTLQALLVLAIVLFCRVNLTATMFGVGLFKLVYYAMRGTFDGWGVSLLQSEGLRGLWTSLYNSPLVMMKTHQATTLGATLTALLLLVPVFFLTYLGIQAYRKKVSERAAASAAKQAKRTTWLRRIYTWADSPFGGP